MKSLPRYPCLYQINTRVWLTELSRSLGRRATLDDIPDAELDLLEKKGFDWIWLLSVWQTGAASRSISRSNPHWRTEFQETLPDLTEADICGSGFAITDYTVHTALGGDAALARLRTRLAKRGLRLMLDFVPNHVALDHPWIHTHPDYFVPGTELQLSQSPTNYTRINNQKGQLILAHGRDPYFPGWPDTLQLNYANPATQAAMMNILLKIAGQCDGVRSDMAMLVLPEVFERSWGLTSQPFWPQAIRRVHEASPRFCFMAEVYWDLEWTLQQQGFDYTYDKRLYDRLKDRQARSAREHLHADPAYLNKMVHFLENHDEPRAISTFPIDMHLAAAAISFLTPVLRFFHQGQLAGFTKRISPHLCSGPNEPANPEVEGLYQGLLEVLRLPVLRDGSWQLLECTPAWEGNETWDCFIASLWRHGEADWLMTAVNYAPHQSQSYVKLPLEPLRNNRWQLQDLIGNVSYDRDGDGLYSQGLYLDMRPWQVCLFTFRKTTDA
ncbi:MAG: alpha-amylase family glycosyl hydrolase [Gemmatales bacterium]